VEQRDRTAVLVIETSGTGSLHTRQAPGWRAALERELGVAAQLARLERSGITAQQIAEISAPFQLEVAETAPRAGRSERIVAFAAVTLALVGLFSGIGYIFSSVTGEKQNRLSEQVISTIPPQSWIDGKIIGLAAVSMVAILNFVAAIGVSFLLGRSGWGMTFDLPTTIGHPGLLLAALLFIGLGFLFWFAFLTAVAAIVDDPHTSTRNQLLFVPVLAFVPAFIAVGDPSATWVRALAVLPPTSAGLMPVRLLMTDVHIVESLLALFLLVAAIWLVRRAAGKVFRLGMLMYGKEPTWAEVRRWMREA
jgi:ABC-2 type transport system permease protein